MVMVASLWIVRNFGKEGSFGRKALEKLGPKSLANGLWNPWKVSEQRFC
jgi:hypothetical protein